MTTGNHYLSQKNHGSSEIQKSIWGESTNLVTLYIYKRQPYEKKETSEFQNMGKIIWNHTTIFPKNASGVQRKKLNESEDSYNSLRLEETVNYKKEPV